MIKILTKLGVPKYFYKGKEYTEFEIMELAERAINYEKKYKELKEKEKEEVN